MKNPRSSWNGGFCESDSGTNLLLIGVDRGIVLGREAEYLTREFCSETQVDLIARSQRCEDVGVLGRIRDRVDVPVVLPGGTDHARTADVDVLGCFFCSYSFFCDGLCERVEVDADEPEGLNPMFPHILLVLLAIEPPEQASMDLRVDGFQSSIHHLPIPSDFRHICGRYSRLDEEPPCPTSADYLEFHLDERSRELDESCFVADRNQRTLLDFHTSPLDAVEESLSATHTRKWQLACGYPKARESL